MSRLTALVQTGRTFGVRDGMLRLGYEIRRGTGLTAWRMRSVQGWRSWDLKQIAPEVSAEKLASARRDGTRKFLFDDVRELGTLISGIIGREAADLIVAEAERVVAGKLPFFGQQAFDCRFPPHWFQNPVTGQSVSPVQPWTRMRFASPAYGDLKFILEPSRFLFAYPLVRAYALNGDERFPQAFWASVEDWARHSPPVSGPLWICGQECSLRILAWSFALHGFIHSLSTTPERVRLLVSMIAAHAWRTAQTLDYARSQRSNHLISEAVGLWTAGTLFPELAESRLWQNLGAHLLHEAVLGQITPHGVGHQHSFNYQRMILHLLLWTLRLGEVHKIGLHKDIRLRTQAAFDFMRHWVDPVSGTTPNYGANDGSAILPLSSCAFSDYRPLLQLGAAVLDRPGLAPGPWDEPALWFSAKPAASPRTANNRTLPGELSPETGYFRVGDENSWAMIRAGRYTRRPFQADQLHVDLWWHGSNLARDAGTYLYNGPAPWNNTLAGTAFHNTVTVDYRDQMRRAGRFLWLDWAQASGRSFCSKNQGNPDRFEGEHSGYKKIGVTHRRTVQWLAGRGWVIIDELTGAGEHHLRLHWLAADLPFKVRESPFHVVFASGKSQITWSMYSSACAEASVIRGGSRVFTSSSSTLPNDEVNLLGWEAPTYGELRPAVSLISETQSSLPVKFVTVILAKNSKLESNNDELLILHRGHESAQSDSEICRVSLLPETNASFLRAGAPIL
jgi:hypothetical protein